MSAGTNLNIWPVIAALVLITAAPAFAGKIIYVDDDGPADFNNIQAAINNASHGDIIMVNPGTYTGDGNRDIDFLGKAITVRSIDPNDPNIVAATIIDCNDEGIGFNFYFDDVNCTLNGLTITNVRIDYTVDYPAGIMCYGSPTIVNCIITNNRVWGIFLGYHGNPTISNCIISNNSGGGIVCGDYSISHPIITNCTISGNKDGGISFWGRDSARMTINNCIISGNSTGFYGGGISFGGAKGGTLDITNCTITGNKAESGGGMYYHHFTDFGVTITNCIFSDNAASKGPEIYIENEYCHGDPSMAIAYSNILGGLTKIYVEQDCELNWDQSNIDADPCFVDSGYWDVNNVWFDGHYHLLPDSPCIDAGDPNYVVVPNETDLDSKPRVINGRIDMGAYEYNPPVPAEVDIDPNTLNLNSKGKWITAFIWLPEEYNVADIDPNSILLEGEIQAEQLQINEQEQVAIVKFSREEVQNILDIGEVELTITGQLSDGTPFEATDMIKVIDKGGKNSGNGLGHPLRE